MKLLDPWRCLSGVIYARGFPALDVAILARLRPPCDPLDAGFVGNKGKASKAQLSFGRSMAHETEIAGVCVLRDAVDLVPFLCGHYLGLGFGHLRFVDDGSSDGSFELLTVLNRQSDQISLTRVAQDTFHQERLVTQAANELIEAGYRVIIPFDADEFWILSQDDINELRGLDAEIGFCGRWSNFVQDRGATSNPVSLLGIKYRAPSLCDATEAAVMEFRRPFVCYWEQKLGVKSRFPVSFERGQHELQCGPTSLSDREFEIFHIPLRSRSELEKRALNYEPRRAAIRRSPLESWQSAFHREVVMTGRIDEVWAANSASSDGHLDVYGDGLRLIHDDRFRLHLEYAASFFRATFGKWPQPRDILFQLPLSIAPPSTRTCDVRPHSLLRQKMTPTCIGHTNSPDMAFERQGFLGPLPILSKWQCELLVRHLNRGELVPPAVWDKGRAITDYLFYDIATQPELLGMLRLLLGENIILWGASVHRRAPRETHPWHTDIETSRAEIRSVSVWIGIENTSQESSLQLVSGSHRLGYTVQELQKQHGLQRGDASSQIIEAWAKEIDRSARLVKPNMVDGEAIIFDGRLWHGTENRRKDNRTAVLLQYAAAAEKIGLPDLAQLDWPFRFRSEQPPIIVVSGVAPPDLNKLEKAPTLGRSAPIAHVLHEANAPLDVDPATGWKPHFIFDGRTCNLEQLTVHASVLSPSCCPHPPHAHPEEEILLVLDGEAVCVIPDSGEQSDPRTEVLRSGEFVYYPAYQYHTIRNASERQLVYIMMKWRGPIACDSCQWSAPVIRPGTVVPKEGENFATYGLMELSTSYLAKLHAHQSVLLPGGGYDPHVDKHDVAIIVIGGFLETCGRTFGPNAFMLHSAGAAHGIRNVGKDAARYLVFEFHAPMVAGSDRIRGIHLLEQLTAAQTQSGALTGEKAALEAALAAVLASSSWRITAPLRGISRFFRRSFQTQSLRAD
jgi:mannose-6-phosphate isomerase-like protein (cupin superfamily)